MFYLKYRPQKVAEIDNSSVRNILEKVLDAKRIPHALLFVGEKGTGKTSAARILAKALNCLENKFSQKNSSVEPCNLCSNCLAITKGYSVDVLEMDAASNRGIEEVKNLIKETSFLPMNSRFRIFIIDEAHMITPDGFNALLKTLEEPPSTAIFILATTNEEKLPKTIVSRCFRINFGRAKKEDILSMLRRICQNEKIDLSDEILDLISLRSENSFRDAAKLLEEVVVQNLKTVEEVENFLGIRGQNNFLMLIEKKDISGTFSFIEEFALNGGNFKILIEDLLEKLRLKLLHKKGLLKDDELESPLTFNEIAFLIKLLLEAYQNMKITPIDSLPLEIALAEFYNKGK